jgi:hypothetical protein
VSFDVVALAGLLALNAFQLVYWSRLQTRLVDRIMSKNYAEYVQLNKPVLPKALESITLPDDSEIEERDVLNVLNGMFGA